MGGEACFLIISLRKLRKRQNPRMTVCPSGGKARNVANLVQRISTYGLLPGGIQPLPQTKTIKKKTKKRQCKVLFEYIPQNEDELELKVGDIIDISEEVEEGWWSGTLNNKLGLFLQFCERIRGNR